MGYAILCTAREGQRLGIHRLAYADRNKTQTQWWTSDEPHLIFEFRKKSAAKYQCERLERNNPEVVPYEEAREIISNQGTADPHGKQEITITTVESDSLWCSECKGGLERGDRALFLVADQGDNKELVDVYCSEECSGEFLWREARHEDIMREVGTLAHGQPHHSQD